MIWKSTYGIKFKRLEFDSTIWFQNHLVESNSRLISIPACAILKSPGGIKFKSLEFDSSMRDFEITWWNQIQVTWFEIMSTWFWVQVTLELGGIINQVICQHMTWNQFPANIGIWGALMRPDRRTQNYSSSHSQFTFNTYDKTDRGWSQHKTKALPAEPLFQYIWFPWLVQDYFRTRSWPDHDYISIASIWNLV